MRHDAPDSDEEQTPTPEWTTVDVIATNPFSDVDLFKDDSRKGPTDSLPDGKAKSVKGRVTPLPGLTLESAENSTVPIDFSSGTPVYGICGFRFQAQDRRLKDEYRTDRTHIPTLKHCQKICEKTTEFHCAAVSYSILTQVCGLSDYNLDDYSLEELTEDENGSNFYGRELCLLQNDGTY